MLAIRRTAASLLAPWEKFLKTKAKLRRLATLLTEVLDGMGTYP